MLNASVRIVIAVLLSVLPPLIAVYFDPTLTSKVHAVIMGLTWISFTLSDRFFIGITNSYKSLDESSALTSREVTRLRQQVARIMFELRVAYWSGFIFRAVQLVSAGLLQFVIGTQEIAYFYLVLVGYTALGASLACMIYSWVSLGKAEDFRSEFIEAERAEKKREEFIRDYESKSLVKS